MIELVLFLYFLGQLGRVELGGGAAFYLYELGLVFWLSTLIWKHRLDPLRHLFKNLKWTYLYFTFSTFSLIISYSNFSFRENVTASLYYLRLLMYVIWFIYLWFHVKRHPSHIEKVGKKLWLLIIAVAVSGILQYFIFPDIAYLTYLGWDPHLNRLFGLFLEPPIAAAIYGIIMLYALSTLSNTSSRNVSLTVYSIMFALTYSRGSFLAAGIVVLIILIRRTHLASSLVSGKNIIKLKSRKWESISLLIVIISLVIVAMLPQEGEGMNLFRTSTVYSRISNYEEGLNLFRENPVVGIGYNHISAARKSIVESPYPDHAASSFQTSFLVILVTGGIIGFILFMGMIYELMSVNLFAEYAILFVCIASITDNVLLHPYILFFLFLTIVLSSDKFSRLSDIL